MEPKIRKNELISRGSSSLSQEEGRSMQGYFDIHSHILPGVDDGAMDMDETRHMLLIAYEEGIRIMIATPHYIVGNKNTIVEKLMEICNKVNNISESADKDFHVLLGNELLYCPDIIEALKAGKALTMDGTRYILVEFLQNSSFREIRDGLVNCIYAGYIPIIAHAERYPCLIKKPNLVYELIKLGIYIQINTTFITNKVFDPRVRFCYMLLKNEWVHFLGTDAHGAYDRIPNMKCAVKQIKKKCGEDMINQLLWENPMTMLKNKHI